jgi:adenine-specific DNA-methyltransferase
LSDLTLSPPPLFDNKQDNIVWRADAFEAAEKLGEVQNLDEAIVYLDPPYNQHPYGSNYHLLNTIALYDRPAIPEMKRGGKSAIRRDWRTSRRSSFNSADAALPSLEELLKVIQARWILCSYSTDGNISIGNLIEAFAKCGEISIETHRYKRYRVSTQRMSPESHNVEFVLVLDKHASPSGQARISECMNAIEEAR